jgi:PAS domain S-box-containing protein
MPRFQEALECGVQSAFGFPALAGDGVAAVLEFFSPVAEPPDEELLEAAEHIAIQIGHVVDRQRAETRLRDAEEKYRTLVERLPLVTYRYSLDGDSTKGYVSPQIENLLGYSLTEWRDDPDLFRRAIHPDDAERALEVIDRTMKSGEPRELELRLIARDGRVVWVRDRAVPVLDEDGRPVFTEGCVVDVTAQREAEEKVSETEARYRTLVEQLPLVTYIDALDEHSSAIYMSPQIEALLGYTPDEWLADRELFPKLLHPEDRDHVMAQVLRTQATGDPFRCEYRLIARDGREVWIRDEDVTVRDEHGRFLYAQGYMLDITERREAELEKERMLERERAANERLRELDGLKDEFVALVSHELRTPLTSICGYLELLQEEADQLTDEHASFVTVLDRNAHRLLRLVNDLLFVAQVDAGRLALDREPLRLDDLADEAVAAARPFADEKGVELSFSVERPPSVDGDRGRLAQLLDNLVSNALKFTPAGGKVDVRVAAQDGRALVTVSDTGIGIAPDEVERLFERFYRASTATERAIPGTGLGLAISRAIVDAHDGTVSVESQVGVGTTFRVVLPPGAKRDEEEQAA